MYIKVCDRCGKQTNNKPAFLEPVPRDKGSLCIDNEWFGEPVCLCDGCMEDFDNFRWKHKRYALEFVEKASE